jgi:chromate transport protein ChrA
MPDTKAQASIKEHASFVSILLIFLPLGLTSFGGPVAHLGYFREEFVNRRRWLSEQHYADLVALCQFLPGPASSQVGLALGLSRGGFKGALAAWCGFTLPSALVLILVAYGVMSPDSGLPQGVIHGLKLVAVAVVAQAVWGMAQSMCRGQQEVALMVAAAAALLLLQAETVLPGLVSEDLFLAGYGAAQAVPGPLFTFAAYLGTSMQLLPGWLGGVIALVAIFTPSFLLVAGVLPFWNRLNRNRPVRSALVAINAAVVGLLLAALYDPIWTSSVRSGVDFALVLLAFVALQLWKLPVWLLVPLFALGGWLF